ncbi:RIBOSOME BIOGENESIS PROTEIN BOP1 BLOCK OF PROLIFERATION 1 PROTEIN [Salix purpurea]|uniref:RIBOSOME BIOGENESIS PROTEIN BOP1 BLOCK OF PROLIFERATION 1 PROTEIN n=1 Tax=Salix purpurea TaxID=77065 RepID=A0A9Q1A7F2_SALPP|nr:RIBOSOME BIOGENESIS PROTEIN BOP1 BLOCK OF PROLIFERATION 1 PROTEIN [Salix purpurea]
MVIFLSRRKIYDEYNDEDVELTKKETKLIRRMLKGKAPHGDFDLYAKRPGHLSYIPAPKPNLPGHEESYNPSLEYIPTQEEINSYQLMDEEDRPKFIPKRFMSLRSIPAYENVVKDSFERCLDLYLCPRVHKKHVAPRNTVGDVPLEWYRDEKHIGYDIARKKLKKKERQDKLDSFLANVDNSRNW